MLLHWAGNRSSESEEASHIVPTLLELIVQMRGLKTRPQTVTNKHNHSLWLAILEEMNKLLRWRSPWGRIQADKQPRRFFFFFFNRDLYVIKFPLNQDRKHFQKQFNKPVGLGIVG